MSSGEAVTATAQAGVCRIGSEWLDMLCRDAWIGSEDGLMLHAYHADQEGRLYAILTYGYTGNGGSMPALGRCFYYHGFSMLMRLRASALEQVAKSQILMLFIHGEEDTFVPFWMRDFLYEASSCEKGKLVVPGADHRTALTVDPDTYWAAVDAFMGRFRLTGALTP